MLLAEDNNTNQMIVKSLLEQIGAEANIAGDGMEAVELYREHGDSISLILMDLHMPVMNGYEAAEKIREISDSVPIIAMTADVILGVREKCERSGIRHYISKPFDPDRFIKIIEEIICESEPDKGTETGEDKEADPGTNADTDTDTDTKYSTDTDTDAGMDADTAPDADAYKVLIPIIMPISMTVSLAKSGLRNIGGSERHITRYWTNTAKRTGIL